MAEHVLYVTSGSASRQVPLSLHASCTLNPASLKSPCEKRHIIITIPLNAHRYFLLCGRGRLKLRQLESANYTVLHSKYLLRTCFKYYEAVSGNQNYKKRIISRIFYTLLARKIPIYPSKFKNIRKNSVMTTYFTHSQLLTSQIVFPLLAPRNKSRELTTEVSRCLIDLTIEQQILFMELLNPSFRDNFFLNKWLPSL